MWVPLLSSAECWIEKGLAETALPMPKSLAALPDRAAEVCLEGLPPLEGRSAAAGVGGLLLACSTPHLNMLACMGISTYKALRDLHSWCPASAAIHVTSQKARRGA